MTTLLEQAIANTPANTRPRPTIEEIELAVAACNGTVSMAAAAKALGMAGTSSGYRMMRILSVAVQQGFLEPLAIKRR